MTTTSYWLEEAHDPLPRTRLDGDPDVAVVGGGITGCSCALALAEAGLRVRLYEAREIAGGASGRNGGFALRGGAASYPVMVDSIGRERAAALWRWTERELQELAQEAGDAFRPTGSLRIAADDEERVEFEEEYEALQADGFAVEWRDELSEPLRDRYPAAIFHPEDGVLQPARVVRRVAARAAAAGVEIHEHTRIASVEETGAETVVIATDGYPSGLMGELEGLIVPTRGQVIATEPIPERFFEVPHYGRHGYDYWHQTEEGRIVAGGFRDVSLQEEFTARRGPDAEGAAGARGLRGVLGRPPAARRLSLGGHLRDDLRLPARGRPRSRRGRSLDRGGLLAATGTSSASHAGGSSRARSSATATRCSISSSLLGYWAGGQTSPTAKQF